MSRLYTVEFDVVVQSKAEIDSAGEELERLGMRIKNAIVVLNEMTIFHGELTLAGGESPAEAHKRISGILNRKLGSRWLCLDETQWDYEFGNLNED